MRVRPIRRRLPARCPCLLRIVGRRWKSPATRWLVSGPYARAAVAGTEVDLHGAGRKTGPRNRDTNLASRLERDRGGKTIRYSDAQGTGACRRRERAPNRPEWG